MKYALFFDLDEAARAALRGAPAAEVEACVVDLLTALEGDSDVDDELLLYSGHAVSDAGHGTADRPVLDWLAASPSERRLALAAGFLAGLWSRNAAPPPPSALQRLLEACAGRSPRDMGWHLATDLLLRLWRRADLPSPTRDALRAELARHHAELSQTGGFPRLLETLAAVR